MPNPSGANNLYTPEPGYGQIKQLRDLGRSAPMSGAPLATHALETPRRAQKQTGPKRSTQGEPQLVAPPLVPPEINYPVAIAQVWKQIAADPQASDEVKAIAAEAQGG